MFMHFCVFAVGIPSFSFTTASISLHPENQDANDIHVATALVSLHQRRHRYNCTDVVMTYRKQGNNVFGIEIQLTI